MLETTMISTVWGSHARPAWIGEYPRISCRYSELKKTTLITAIDMSTCTELPHATEGSLSRRPGSSGCFFFQAEDGIRDVAVTGVQTCALPIFFLLVSLQVWRVHELFPTLAVHGLPILTTVAAIGLFLLGRDPRRRIGSVNAPVVWAALGILGLVALSVPGSLYPGHSLNFLLKDYLRTVLLMVLVAASGRGLADLRRLSWLQLAGVTLFSAVIVARAQMGEDGRLREVAYYDVNDLALLIVCTLPLVVYLWRRPAQPWSRILLVAATVFLMVTLGKTQSRGGFLGFLAVVAYLLLRLRGVSKIQRVATVAFLGTMLVAVACDKNF